MAKRRAAKKGKKANGPPKEVLLVLLLLDNSSSITAFGNVGAVLDGYRAFVQETQKSPGEVRLMTVFFHNGEREKKFVPIAKVQPLTPASFPTFRGTPLYPSMYRGLQALLNEAARLRKRGYTVRTVTVLFADGQNNVSGIGPEDVLTVVTAMKSELCHIIAARGVHYGNVDFHRVFEDMGIDPHQIEVLKGGHEIVANMGTTGGGVSAASTDVGTFQETMEKGLGRVTDPA